MGLFDVFKGLQNYHETGEGASEISMEQFGDPEYSLYTSNKLGSIHQQIDITDENDNLRYYTKSSIVQIKNKTDIMDANDNIIAHFEKKPISLHELHYVNMSDGLSFTLSNELFHVIKDVTNIEGLGWKLLGNVVGLNFTLFDENQVPVAVIGRKLISIHDKYCIDIYQPQFEQIVVAIVIALQKMLNDRRNNESESSFSFGSGDNE